MLNWYVYSANHATAFRKDCSLQIWYLKIGCNATKAVHNRRYSNIFIVIDLTSVLLISPQWSSLCLLSPSFSPPCVQSVTSGQCHLLVCSVSIRFGKFKEEKNKNNIN